MAEHVAVPSSDSNVPATATATTLHNTLPGRSAAGAHPATAVTYDNDTSGLTADTVQEALDELAASGGGGAVDSVNGETGVVVLDASDVGAIPATAIGLATGERNMGAWDAATSYVAGDVVSFGGILYAALAPSLNDSPPSAAWDDISARPGLVVALGVGASAAGDGSVSVGSLASAEGTGSVAVGFGASAAGDGDVNLAHVITGHVTDPLGTPTPDGLTLATGFADLPETAAATNPAADHWRLVARTDGIYVRSDAGVEVGPIGAGGGGGIPETLIDAAGDLIVGTAADTAARLAIGAAGTVLTSNGTTAAWAAPGGGLMQSIGYVSGGIYGLLGSSASVNYHLAAAAGRWVAHPIWLPAGNYAGLSVLSTAAAVATWRLGIYNGTPEGATTLLHDCGTVDMNATPGSLLASSAFTVPTTGLYWAAVLVDAHTATPTVWSFRGVVSDIPALPYLGARLGAAAAVRSYFARYANSVSTGSMPATAPTQGPTDLPPIIRAHAA